MQSRRRLAALLVTAFACTDPDARTAPTASGGTVVIATTSDPDALFPPAALTVEARQATELIYEYLADAGVSMNAIGDSGFVKQIARDWTWSNDSMSIAFRIHPGATWHDSRRVTSRDVAFSWAVYADTTVGSPVRQSLADIDSVTTPDDSTAVFWFARRSPRQFFEAAATMLILPEHSLGTIRRDSLRAVAAGRPPMGSGRFRFTRWDRGSRLEIAATPAHYRGRAGLDRVIWTVTPEYQSAIARLTGGEADVFAPVRQESVASLTAGGRFNLVSLPGMDYVFAQLNLRDPARPAMPHPLFGSRELRRALTMALDRAAMVRNLFDTLATVPVGPTVRALASTDTTVAQLPFDAARAEQLLDSLGWQRPAAGAIRSRGGRHLSFATLVPVSSLSRQRMAVLMQEQLRRVGVEMRIESMDFSAFSSRQRARDFDVALASWSLGSSLVALRETWSSRAADAGGLNYGGYRNPAFDTLVDSALSTYSPGAAREYLRRAYQLIVDDAPAIWLYEPRTVLAVASRIRTTPMRPNAWWLGIGDWSIPQERRIPRDRPMRGDSGY